MAKNLSKRSPHRKEFTDEKLRTHTRKILQNQNVNLKLNFQYLFE